MADRPPTKSERPRNDLDGDLILPGSAASVVFSDEDAGEELEADDRQAAEIREIFATAFPQYLLPIEEILHELASGKPDADSAEVAQGMIASLIEASRRMGVENVSAALADLHASMQAVDWRSGALGTEDRDRIIACFRALKGLADAMSTDSGASVAKQQTIFAAFKDKPGISEQTLRKLGAAGLVTIDQVLVAKPEEIAVVAGIDLELARRIVEEVRRAHATPASARPAPPRENERDGPPRREPSEPEQLRRELKGKLDVRAALEAEVAALRTEIRALKERVSGHRTELVRIGRSAVANAERIRELDTSRSALASTVVGLRAAHAAEARKCAELSESIQAKRQELARMTAQRRELGTQRLLLERHIARLLGSLGDLRRSIAKGSSK